MTTTGTYAYNPSASDLVLNAFRQIQISRRDLTAEHLIDAYDSFSLLLIDLSNRNPLRWGLENQSQILSSGTATYTLTNRTLAIAIAYLDTTVGSDTVSRVIGPISATEYAAIPLKGTQAPPTSYWFNLQTTPTITLYPTPDSTATYTMRMVTFRQMQDVQLDSGVTVDAPYRFLDALATGLAARLAQIYRPEEEDKLNARYEMRMNLAKRTDQERAPLFLTPGLSGYFR